MLDNGDDAWGGSKLGNGTYDASLFGWQSTNTYALNSEANYITDGLNNFGGYSNEKVDGWYKDMSTNTDADKETELIINIEKQMNDDAFGVNIFQFPRCRRSPRRPEGRLDDRAVADDLLELLGLGDQRGRHPRGSDGDAGSRRELTLIHTV